MDGLNWDELSAEERLLAGQAVLNFRELNKACDEAADGTVLEARSWPCGRGGKRFAGRSGPR